MRRLVIRETLHTIKGQGSNGCTAWGCSKKVMYEGAEKGKYKLRVDYAQDGGYTVTLGKKTIKFDELEPAPTEHDKKIIVV